MDFLVERLRLAGDARGLNVTDNRRRHEIVRTVNDPALEVIVARLERLGTHDDWSREMNLNLLAGSRMDLLRRSESRQSERRQDDDAYNRDQ
jgi:hypothetical protein